MIACRSRWCSATRSSTGASGADRCSRVFCSRRCFCSRWGWGSARWSMPAAALLPGRRPLRRVPRARPARGGRDAGGSVRIDLPGARQDDVASQLRSDHGHADARLRSRARRARLDGAPADDDRDGLRARDDRRSAFRGRRSSSWRFRPRCSPGSRLRRRSWRLRRR